MGPLPGTYPRSTEKKNIFPSTRNVCFRPNFLPTHTFHSYKWQDNCHIGKTLSPCHVCLLPTLNPSFFLVTGQLPYGKTPSFVFSLSPCIQVHFFVVWQDNCPFGKTLSTPAFFLYNLSLHGWSKVGWSKVTCSCSQFEGCHGYLLRKAPLSLLWRAIGFFPCRSPFTLLAVFSLCASSSASSSRNSVYYLGRFQWSWTFNILLANWTMRLMLSAVGLVLMKYLFHFKHLTEWEFLSLICGFHVSLHESIRMMHSCYGNFLIVEFPSLLKFQNHTLMGICLAFLEIWGRLIKGIRDHLKYELVGVNMAPSNQKRVSSKRRKTVRMNKGKWEN